MNWVGKWLVGVGVIHSLFGLVFMRSTLAVLAAEGFFNTVNGQPIREAAFWFLYTGLLLILFGVMVNRFETLTLELPAIAVWGFTGLVCVGAVVMPVSGIWLLVPAVFGLLLYNRRIHVAR